MRFFRDIKDFILSYKYPLDKYFLVSFPKTGRTWLMHMIDDLQNKGKQKIHIEYTHDMSEIIIENGYRQDPKVLFNYNHRYRYRRSKVIFLVRDPRDVIVSHFYQVTRRSKNPFVFNSISEFVRHKVYGFERIIFFYNMWYKQKYIPKDFLLIKYEDLINDGVNETCKITKYLNLDVSLDQIKDTYINFTAKKMRKKEIKDNLDLFNASGEDKNSLKVRNAKVGGYTNELNDEDIQFCKSKMKNLSTFFDYN